MSGTYATDDQSSDTYDPGEFFGAETDLLATPSLPFVDGDSFDFENVIPEMDTASVYGIASEIALPVDPAQFEVSGVIAVDDGADLPGLVILPHLGDLAP